MFPDDNLLFSSLRSLVKKMHRLGDREMAPYGMGHGELRLLLLLYGNDGCGQDYLISRLTVDRTNVGRALAKLEKMGLVRRIRSLDDGRANVVFLSDRGREMQEPLLAAKERIERKVTGALSDDEIDLLSRLLFKMDEGLSDGS
ncbi:winged helix-turn-helix transcriptional regulator [Aminithiophilus ramosus]|uniref:Winged helix-turn-helix transcriptional regulator n=2 Tax=Synergistales TaxID=649776 RepID=A0A9Q7ACY7_9BACT|nr:MarR family winged helix-turn-helix transcriptional regulator [Aminithiophilus ramosus]QTX32114.1 winged helix-turn-helix transcriptional regulator [Aminithiophilus ramosus]QVL35982.1 winged helix-turn-helix transcriptional regulator [Synergistota bacterium]